MTDHKTGSEEIAGPGFEPGTSGSHRGCPLMSPAAYLAGLPRFRPRRPQSRGGPSPTFPQFKSFARFRPTPRADARSPCRGSGKSPSSAAFLRRSAASLGASSTAIAFMYILAPVSLSAASTDFLGCSRGSLGLLRAPNGYGHLAYNQKLRAEEVDLLEAVHRRSHVDAGIAPDASLPEDRPDDPSREVPKAAARSIPYFGESRYHPSG